MHKLISFIVLSMFINLAQAGEGRVLLDAFLKNTTSIQANFKQLLHDNRGGLLQESSGAFSLNRPGKFLWDYLEPFPQQIISNGEKIWIYDSELEQVSVKKYSLLLSGSPVILLDQNRILEEEYEVFDQGKKNNQYWIVLTPKTSNSEFKEIKIGMTKDGISTMKLKDSFEQITTIMFTSLVANPVIDKNIFNFVPPKGVDVIGDF